MFDGMLCGTDTVNDSLGFTPYGEWVHLRTPPPHSRATSNSPDTPHAHRFTPTQSFPTHTVGPRRTGHTRRTPSHPHPPPHPPGDVWYPMKSYYKVPLAGNPTRSDRPGSMYDVVDDGEKNIGAAVRESEGGGWGGGVHWAQPP